MEPLQDAHHDGQSNRRKIQELQLLFEVSRILDRSLDIKQVLHPVLKAMGDNLGMLRGTITLLNRPTGEIFIEAAYGLSTSQREKGKYRLGEGITGKVVETGQPMVIPKIAENATFLNRTGARKGLKKKDISFICVPIKLGNETIGALEHGPAFRGEHQPRRRRAAAFHHRLHDRTGGETPPVGAGGTDPPDGGEQPAPGGAPGPLPADEHHRKLPGDAAGVRPTSRRFPAAMRRY